jgi:hypothetical protein
MNSTVYKSSNSSRIPGSQANSPETKDKLKIENKEKDYAQKFNSKQASLSSQIISTGTTET